MDSLHSSAMYTTACCMFCIPVLQLAQAGLNVAWSDSQAALSPCVILPEHVVASSHIHMQLLATFCSANLPSAVGQQRQELSATPAHALIASN